MLKIKFFTTFIDLHLHSIPHFFTIQKCNIIFLYANTKKGVSKSVFEVFLNKNKNKYCKIS